MQTLKIGKLDVKWLEGGIFHLDGGALFGVVPKPLWEKVYPANEKNQLKLKIDPMFIEINNKKVLIDSGIGRGKLTEKQKRNYGCIQESQIDISLKSLELSTKDIDFVLLTHMHFDHSCGLTTKTKTGYKPTFPNAQIITSKPEWYNIKNTNIRTEKSYWKENWQTIESQIVTFEESLEILPGLTITHTGGHTLGHNIITIESEDQRAIHLGDLMPTHAHLNPIWVSAIDDFPIDSALIKEKFINKFIEKKSWFIFYHDIFYRAIKVDKDKKIIDYLGVG